MVMRNKAAGRSNPVSVYRKRKAPLSQRGFLSLGAGFASRVNPLDWHGACLDKLDKVQDST